MNAKEKVKGETALMFAAAYGRTDVVRALTARGADVTVTTKVLDMAVFNKEEGERLGAARSSSRRRRPRPRGRGAGGRRRRRAGAASTRTPSRGSSVKYNYTELVGYWGGMAAIHFAARDGRIDAVKALVEAKADVNQPTVGDNSSPMLVADDQRPLRSREVPARPGRRSEPRPRTTA